MRNPATASAVLASFESHRRYVAAEKRSLLNVLTIGVLLGHAPTISRMAELIEDGVIEVRQSEGLAFVEPPTFADAVRRAIARQVQVDATPHDVPLSPCEDAEVEQLYPLTPVELADELVSRGYSTHEANRIVEEAAREALGKPTHA